MSGIGFLPLIPIHQPQWADTREVRSVVRVHTSGIEAALAEKLTVVGGTGRPGLSWQLGFEAGGFMGFRSEGELTFSLLTFDGLVAIPLDLAAGSWRARMEWVHLSAHFADGIRHGDELPDASRTGAFSREWIGLTVFHEGDWFRPRIGVEQIIHAADEGGGMVLATGFDVNGFSSPGLYGGLDLRVREEQEWALSGAFELGVQWFEEGGGIQLGVCGYSGMNDAGKHSSETENYLGLTLGIQPPRLFR